MLTIVMSTYFPQGNGGESRAQGAVKCLEAFMARLSAPEEIRLCIADDGSHYIDYIDKLLIMAEAHWHTPSLYTSVNRRGIGGSLNKALEAIPAHDHIMYTTDDWLLLKYFTVKQAIQLLQEGYDYVRIGPTHPNLNCITRFNTTIGWWLHIVPGYGYCFGTRPFIAKRRFFDIVGPFDEDLNAYETERLYTERVNRVRVPIALAQMGTITLEGPWKHIGVYEVGTIGDFNHKSTHG
jgi:hypothetical protein